MKLYHTQTREDYKALMDELESKGIRWHGGQKPHEFDGFENYESETIFKVEDNVICYFSMSFYKNNYNEFELIEYKAEKDVKVFNESVLEIIENLVQATNLKACIVYKKPNIILIGWLKKMEVEDDTKL